MWETGAEDGAFPGVRQPTWRPFLAPCLVFTAGYGRAGTVGVRPDLGVGASVCPRVGARAAR